MTVVIRQQARQLVREVEREIAMSEDWDGSILELNEFTERVNFAESVLSDCEKLTWPTKGVMGW
jgi:hypothetical protein